MVGVERWIKLLDPRHVLFLPMLLKKEFARYPLGSTHERNRPPCEVRQHQRRYQRVVAYEIDLCKSGGGVDHAVRVRHFQGFWNGACRSRLPGGMHGLLANNDIRFFVRSQTVEYRVTNVTSSRPFTEGNFRDKPGFDPMRVFIEATRFHKRAIRRSNSVQPCPEVLQRLIAESRAHIPCISEFSVSI